MSDLTRFRDHCRARAAVEPAEPLWPLLADEVDRWLAGGCADEPDPETDPLWAEEDA